MGSLKLEINWISRKHPICENPNVKELLKDFQKKKAKKSKAQKKLKEEALNHSTNSQELNESSETNNKGFRSIVSSKNQSNQSKKDNSNKKQAINSIENSTKESRSCNEYCYNGKYTCRYDIQIDNQKDFEVVKLIIGFKVGLLLRDVI